MDKEIYEVPTITTIASLRELTQAVNKCHGSGDTFLPQLDLKPAAPDACPPA